MNPPEPWRRKAACTGLPPAWWYASPLRKGKASNTPNPVYVQALKVCAECPVRGECGTAGEHELYGLWGGTQHHHKYQAGHNRVIKWLSSRNDT